VLFTTPFSGKGLEADCVVIAPDVNKLVAFDAGSRVVDTTAATATSTSLTPCCSGEDVDVNVFYVALTRALQHLVILSGY
jgi:ATP-dependent exoDNAse (exonuclease V) beta subunit